MDNYRDTGSYNSNNLHCAECWRLETIIKELTKDNEELYEQREYNAQLCKYYDKEAKRVRAALTKIKCDLLPLINEHKELNGIIHFIDETLEMQEEEEDNMDVTLTFSYSSQK